MPNRLDRSAEQLSALGHPVRLAILRFVVQAGGAGASAGEIQERVGLPASTLSHHLKRLVDADLFSTRLEGNLQRAIPSPEGADRVPVGGLLQARSWELLLMVQAPTLARRVVSELVGTALLLAVVLGSGIMGERLASGNVAIALLANTLATGAGLVAPPIRQGWRSSRRRSPKPV